MKFARETTEHSDWLAKFQLEPRLDSFLESYRNVFEYAGVNAQYSAVVAG